MARRAKPSAPTAAPRAAPAVPSAGPSWPVALLALAGLAVAAYLTWLKLTGNPAVFCGPGSGCDIVQTSRYGTLLRLPTAVWGGIFYAAVAGLALAGLTPRRWQIAFLLSAGAAGFSLYLTGLSLFVLGATCVYCLLSTAIALALTGLLAWRRPAAAGRRGATRWSRMGVEAAAAAAGAIVVGAFIFAGQGGLDGRAGGPGATPHRHQGRDVRGVLVRCMQGAEGALRGRPPAASRTSSAIRPGSARARTPAARPASGYIRRG